MQVDPAFRSFRCDPTHRRLHGNQPNSRVANFWYQALAWARSDAKCARQLGFEVFRLVESDVVAVVPAEALVSVGPPDLPIFVLQLARPKTPKGATRNPANCNT